MSKLDLKTNLKTKLFLYMTKANNLGVPNFANSKIEINEGQTHDVYVFDNYEDYFNYFKVYLKYVDEELIQKAIYTTGKKGQVVAFKRLCERIIIKQRTKEFYEIFDQEKIDEIHSKGKITPMEKVAEYESHDLCAPGDAIGSASNRCRFFDDCHECLLEYASHNQEYDRIDFKLVNYDIGQKVLKKHHDGLGGIIL